MAVCACRSRSAEITVLPCPDRELIRAGPKPFFGVSDTTNLRAALSPGTIGRSSSRGRTCSAHHGHVLRPPGPSTRPRNRRSRWVVDAACTTYAP
ncbi:hypothetical protein BV882_10340 [Streptomyces sp. 46]|nr:hypothetical protein BV882_10340 [Streptomyces sp. 46]